MRISATTSPRIRWSFENRCFAIDTRRTWRLCGDRVEIAGRWLDRGHDERDGYRGGEQSERLVPVDPLVQNDRRQKDCDRGVEPRQDRDDRELAVGGGRKKQQVRG